MQIVDLIKFLVKNMQGDMSFQSIIKEARNKVKELQNEKRPVKNYFAPVIKGDGNVVGDGNAVGAGNVSGNSNKIIGNTIQVNDSESISKTLGEFEMALHAINDSHELDDDMKTQLVEIMETAMEGVSEQSKEKQKEAQSAFGYIKSFLTRIAPKLVQILANIATIATFFNIIH